MNTVKFYEYSGFFHYDADQHWRPLVDFLQEESIESCWSLEHQDHVNITDRHVQWCVRRAEPWTKRMDNMLSIGKLSKYLVKRKIANVGEKSSKRYGKIVSHVPWLDAVKYVLKGKLPVEGQPVIPHGWSEYPDYTHIPASMYPPSDYKVQSKLDKFITKPKSFQTKLLDFWKESGSPRDLETCLRLACQYTIENKWSYYDNHQIARMGEWLAARVNKEKSIDAFIKWYNDSARF